MSSFKQCEIVNLIQNCATLKNTTDNLKSLINGLLERIFSLESEVTALKTSVKRFSQSELIQRATEDKTVVEIDPMSIKAVVPPRPKYYKQPNLTADTSVEEDIICIDSTSEPKHSQARQVHTKLNQESTLKHNKILVQAEVHADKNGVPCIPLTNTFHHQRVERKRLQRGRLSQPPKIKAAFHNRRRYLIYVGKLDKQTSEDALRYHIIDIGLQQTDIADVIKLPCKNQHESSFCVSVNDELAETVLLSTGQWPYGTRVRPFHPSGQRKQNPPRFLNRALRLSKQVRPLNGGYNNESFRTFPYSTTNQEHARVRMN